MDYRTEFNVREFPFRSGAKQRAEDARERGKLDELGSLIEATFEGGETPPSRADINDFVWFDESAQRLIYGDADADEGD